MEAAKNARWGLAIKVTITMAFVYRSAYSFYAASYGRLLFQFAEISFANADGEIKCGLFAYDCPLGQNESSM